MGEQQKSKTVFERALKNLSGAWREAANTAARSIGMPEPLLPPTDRRALKRFLRECLEARGGEVSSRMQAAELGRLYLEADAAGRRRFRQVLAEDFGVEHEKVEAAIAAFAAAEDEAGRYRAEQELRRALIPSRSVLLRKFNGLERGVKFLVDFRADLLADEERSPALSALDDDLKELLASWFDFGFLDMEQITWKSSAALLEKLIAYEAVHAIRSWDDLHNRLDSDRRCYALFHPRMPEEPLAFVEVALHDGLSGSVQELLDEEAPLANPSEADSAIFYSISNTQAGLKGIAFGEFLIKRAVHRLSAEQPKLKIFATLSPVPGFARWLAGREDAIVSAVLSQEQAGEIAKLAETADGAEGLRLLLKRVGWHEDKAIRKVLKEPLLRLVALYFEQKRQNGEPLDAVARFHLRNGARLERINWLGDVSVKGLRQSHGIMVNYRYLPETMEANHEAYASQRQIAVSSEVKALLKSVRGVEARISPDKNRRRIA
jgi:malonyl-CoA decarboxylase